DLDDFKRINDTHGHAAGDSLLQFVAERLRRSTREGDTVARFGGDQFAVVIEEDDALAAATSAAARIQNALRQPFELGGNQVFVSASLGIAIARRRERDPEALLRSADIALHEAKTAGKAQYRVFQPEMDAALRRRVGLEHELRRAISGEQLGLAFQPIVDLSSGALIGVEALARWNLDGVAIHPLEFIPIAEETGLIVPLGEWILSEACRLAAGWYELAGARPLELDVNVSPRQLREPGFDRRVEEALSRAGLPAERLTLELTESAALVDDPVTHAAVGRLRELGVAIVIDDFGTGYSGLDYVKRLRPSGLKIDGSFVAGIESDPQDRAIVSAAIAFGRALGLTVTAEGIESDAQRVELAVLGADRGQGFLFGRPTRPEDVPAVLRRVAGRAASQGEFRRPVNLRAADRRGLRAAGGSA
ncbi:MAG TPA: bifunctional diguanylate cyclase/phosphodiesterase, partial [Candidatus Limnocylindrales bacterium]|nr:bifunctional diguanylate cyclase/phosphodiesterase [Candidatus Limnocylindrales bacterium]